MAIHITFDDLAGLWYVWFLFFAFGMITLIVPILLKRRYKLVRTPFDFELRGKLEDFIKNKLSTTLCGNAIISLNII